ncbi:MAG: hypothetical protein CME34_07000 [Gordonia sp.]|nr:hypothetical protein [Gordonia sp. (in: high G+C Gram-positive bacteria)]
MLVRSAAQIRAQMHDRQVTIVTGGLSPAGDDGMNIAPATFVKNLYDAGRQSAWDAIGLHPYTFPALPEDLSTAEWNPFQNLDKIRTIVDNHGDIGKQIWFTEYGAPTQGPRSVTPLVQAKSIMQILNAAAKDIHLGPVFIHSSRDRGLDPDNIEHHFGLLNSNFEPKVAFFSVRLLAVCVGD